MITRIDALINELLITVVRRLPSPPFSAIPPHLHLGPQPPQRRPSPLLAPEPHSLLKTISASFPSSFPLHLSLPRLPPTCPPLLSPILLPPLSSPLGVSSSSSSSSMACFFHVRGRRSGNFKFKA